GVGHRSGEEDDRGAHRRRVVPVAGRTGHGGGEVVEVAQDRRERCGQHAAAHVLDDVAEPAREHGGGEPVAAVAVGALLLRHGAARSISSYRSGPTSAPWPGQTKVVDRPSRITAGPRTLAPTGRASRSYSAAASGSGSKWRISIVRVGSGAGPSRAASRVHST